MTDAQETDAFPYEHFCNYFPQFDPAKDEANTPEFVAACGERATMYVSGLGQSVWLHGRRRIYAVCLLAAHILFLAKKEQSGADKGGSGLGGADAVGPVTSASVGGVSVSMQTPTTSGDGAFEWWLNKTPFGQEFLALIRTRGPMMAFVGSRTPVLPLR